MAHRYVRNTAILAKIETVYGTDPVPTGAANALLVSNLSINPLNANNVDRANVKPYFGGNEQLVGTHFVECGFDLEIAGSGTAGTAAKWGPLVRACSMAEVLTAVTSAEYTPITNGQESVTIYWFDDGLKHAITGAKGTFEIKMGIGERPVFSFKFTGLYNAPTATANPAVTLTAWQKPLVITDDNTGDVVFGCTYAAAALSGGTTFPSKGFPSLNLANVVNYIPLLGGDSVDITDRAPTFKTMLDLTAAQEVSQMAAILANTSQAVGFSHGTTAGNQIVVFMPSVQLISPAKEEDNGRRLFGVEGRIIPVAGNDELVICAK